MNGGKYMICDLCGNVTENKRAIGIYMRAARITYIECPECGCALSIKELLPGQLKTSTKRLLIRAGAFIMPERREIK